MNEVALEIIKQLGDELQKIRDEFTAAKKVLAAKEAETVKAKADMNFWFSRWQEIRDKYEREDESCLNAVSNSIQEDLHK